MSDTQDKYTFGMIGLGTMGCNLLLNIADHGFSGAGYDKDPQKVVALDRLGAGKKVKGFAEIDAFVKSLQQPRAIMMLVPAGKIVDSVIAELTPLLSKGDIIIDGGNSHFTDTERRSVEVEAKGLHFFGMGISGGEEGARHGPSMMPGGDREAYTHLQNIFESIAAKVDGAPCVTYIGPGASGHFVKMVHNGIEYALMQLIAETYGIMKTCLQMDNASIQKVFSNWNEGRLQSFLLEITSEIFLFKVPGSNDLLLDQIKDEAKSKGTGKWTSQAAMDLHLPISSIDTAVSMRDLSKYKTLRKAASAIYDHSSKKEFTSTPATYVAKLEQAYYCSMAIIYAQGMHLLYEASAAFNYQLQLAEIAKIWRGGCIIRSSFLENIYTAFEENDQLQHLLLYEKTAAEIKNSLAGLRTVVSDAVMYGLAVPVYAASLSYFDAFCTDNLPSNLIQAQRDFFGAHTYELIGKEGVFHTDWQVGKV